MAPKDWQPIGPPTRRNFDDQYLSPFRPFGLHLLLLVYDLRLVKGVLCLIEYGPPRLRFVGQSGPHFSEGGVLGVAVGVVRRSGKPEALGRSANGAAPA